MRIGNRAPIAVVAIAMATRPAAGNSPSASPAKASARAAASDIIQPRKANRVGAPRTRLGFISSPPIRNRMASPRSKSTASRSLGSTSCSPCGPMATPNRISRTTAGRTARRRTAGTHAATAMAKNTVMAPTAMSAASILFPLSTCLGPTLPRRLGHRNPHHSGASRRYPKAVHHPAWWGAT